MEKLNYGLSKNSAFSLLELIIAIAILSAGIVGVMQAFSYSARVSGLSCDITDANFLAKDIIQELEFKEKLKLINDSIPDISGRVGKFQWQYEFKETSEPGLYNLRLLISWERLNRKEDLSLRTYLKQ